MSRFFALVSGYALTWPSAEAECITQSRCGCSCLPATMTLKTQTTSSHVGTWPGWRVQGSNSPSLELITTMAQVLTKACMTKA